MRKITFLALLVAVLVAPVFAEEKPKNVMFTRTGFDTEVNSTYNYSQYMRQYGPWIPINFGYVDFGHTGQHREFFAGFGARLLNSKHTTVTQVLYVKKVKDAKEDFEGLFPWTKIDFRFLDKKIVGEAVFVECFSNSSRDGTQISVDRAKVEYELGRVRPGIGYSGSKCFGAECASHERKDKPFLDVSLELGKLGELEIWYQKIPKKTPDSPGSQFQFRHKVVF